MREFYDWNESSSSVQNLQRLVSARCVMSNKLENLPSLHGRDIHSTKFASHDLTGWIYMVNRLAEKKPCLVDGRSGLSMRNGRRRLRNVGAVVGLRECDESVLVFAIFPGAMSIGSLRVIVGSVRFLFFIFREIRIVLYFSLRLVLTRSAYARFRRGSHSLHNRSVRVSESKTF